jgi:hypothetical protein
MFQIFYVGVPQGYKTIYPVYLSRQLSVYIFSFQILTAENLAYNSSSNQSSTSPEFSSQLAVDGLDYTCSLTLKPTKVYILYLMLYCLRREMQHLEKPEYLINQIFTHFFSLFHHYFVCLLFSRDIKFIRLPESSL